MRSDLAALALVLQQLQRDDARHDHKADEVGDRTRDQQRQTADDSQHAQRPAHLPEDIPLQTGGDGENARPIVVTEEIEQPFEWIVKFRYAGQTAGSQALWWRFAKPERPAVLPAQLSVRGEDILLLYR